MQKNIWLGVLAVCLLACLLLYSTYNGLVNKEEAVFTAWSNVESTLQRRADLIPNLVATVKGYAEHERETLTRVIEARAKALQPVTPQDLANPAVMQEFQQSQNALGQALGRLLALAESYPDLKANENFRDLQNQLEGTENRINVARERYNGAVQVFNGSIRAFPGSVVNNFFLHLERKEYFKATEAAKEAPKVSF